ncbi:hypothetical protein FRC18_008490 [Serendipita sp. 400]|nr:hypothetical protein FRC18_008490 [Serendipita sp. 400]
MVLMYRRARHFQTIHRRPTNGHRGNDQGIVIVSSISGHLYVCHASISVRPQLPPRVTVSRPPSRMSAYLQLIRDSSEDEWVLRLVSPFRDSSPIALVFLASIQKGEFTQWVSSKSSAATMDRPFIVS